MRRASFNRARISGACRCSILSSEPRAALIISRPGSVPWTTCQQTAAPKIRSCLPLHQQDLFRIVQFAELDFDDLIAGGLHLASDEAGLDGYLTVSTVAKRAELHFAGASFAEQSIHCGPRGTPGVKNVIHENDVLARDWEIDFCFLHDRLRAECGEIITVKRDIEHAYGYGCFLDSFDHVGQALSERYPASPYTDQRQVHHSIISFDDFVGQPYQGTLDFRSRHQFRLFADVCLARRGFRCHEWCIIRVRSTGEQEGRKRWKKRSYECAIQSKRMLNR